MKILTYPLGDLATNSYVLVNETTGEAIAIDVGDNGNFLLLEGLKRDFTLKAVLLTHGHFDHIGGVGDLYSKGITVYMGENELEFIKLYTINCLCGLSRMMNHTNYNKFSLQFLYTYHFKDEIKTSFLFLHNIFYDVLLKFCYNYINFFSKLDFINISTKKGFKYFFVGNINK